MTSKPSLIEEMAGAIGRAEHAGRLEEAQQCLTCQEQAEKAARVMLARMQSFEHSTYTGNYRLDRTVLNAFAKENGIGD